MDRTVEVDIGRAALVVVEHRCTGVVEVSFLWIFHCL